MATLELVVERRGGWSALQGLLSQDAALLREGERYQQVFYLKPYPPVLAPVLKAEVEVIVQALRRKGVEGVSGSLKDEQAVLSYQVGFNPLAILGAIIALAIFLVLFLIGYAIFRIAKMVPGLPDWVALGLAALGVFWVGNRLRGHWA